MQLGGFHSVLYACLLPNIPSEDLTPEYLAKLAIKSATELAQEGNAHALEKNGIRYLEDNIEQGVITPLTEAYRRAILAATGTASLGDAQCWSLRALWNDL